MSRAASLPGTDSFPENLLFLKRPLVPGSFAARGRFFLRNRTSFEQATCPGQLRCLGQNCFSKTDFQEFWDSYAQNKTEISRNGLSRILVLLCAEQDVGKLKKCTFRIPGLLCAPQTRQSALHALLVSFRLPSHLPIEAPPPTPPPRHDP